MQTPPRACAINLASPSQRINSLHSQIKSYDQIPGQATSRPWPLEAVLVSEKGTSSGRSQHRRPRNSESKAISTRQEKFITFTMTGASVSTALLASFAKLPMLPPLLSPAPPLPSRKAKNWRLWGRKAGVRDPRKPTKEQQRLQGAVEEDGG
jgi:hypothetical protein